MSNNVPHHRGGKKLPAESTPKAGDAAPVQSPDTHGVGMTRWDFASSMLRSFIWPALGVPIYLRLICGLTLLAIFGGVSWTHGQTIVESVRRWSGMSELTPVAGAAPGGLKALIAAGRERKKPYVLDDVTVLIRVKDVKNGAGWERHVEWTINYKVHALQPIKGTDKLFKERYLVSGARTMRWFGSEKEIDTTDGGYHVMFNLAEGAARTITTRATNVFDLPLEDKRVAFGQRLKLDPDELFLSYENDEDVIGQLSIIIDSDTLDISPVGQAAKRSKLDGSVTPDEECRLQSAGEQRTLSARWEHLMPNEEVGIHMKVGRRRRT